MNIYFPETNIVLDWSLIIFIWIQPDKQQE